MQQPQRDRIATRVTLRAREVEPAAMAVTVLLSWLPVVAEELAATLPRPPPRAQPMAPGMVLLAQAPEAAQGAQAAQAAQAYLSSSASQASAAQAAMRPRTQ